MFRVALENQASKLTAGTGTWRTPRYLNTRFRFCGAPLEIDCDRRERAQDSFEHSRRLGYANSEYHGQIDLCVLIGLTRSCLISLQRKQVNIYLLPRSVRLPTLAYPVVSANRKPSRRRFKLGATYGPLLKQADKEKPTSLSTALSNGS